MIGTVTNALAIVFGAVLGVIFKKGIPERISDIILKALGICIVYIGIEGSLQGENTLVLIASMVLGTLIGSIIDIDKALNKFGDKLNSKLSKGEGSISEGFINSSLVFCVGAMAIVGSLNSGLGLGHEMIFTKSVLDGIASIMFAATMGIGVLFSAVCVFVYQGSIVLLASFLQPILTDFSIAQITCAGSLLIVIIGLNTMKITNIKVANMIPALLISPIICFIMERI